MNNRKYESPRFEFQEMQLLERIAAQCWSNNPIKGWLDMETPPNGKYDVGEIVFNVDPGNCGQNVATVIQDWFAANHGIAVDVSDVTSNTDSSRIHILNS